MVRRKRSENLIFFETDKSGKLSVDEIENFSEKMSVHVEAGDEIDENFVLKVEEDLNARAKSWARILCLGERWGHSTRVKEAVTSTSGLPPPIYTP